MSSCFFVSDLHGKISRYQKLFALIESDLPEAVFFGGDLLPHVMMSHSLYDDFASDYFFPQLRLLRDNLKNKYPDIFLILGNDDARIEEAKFEAAADEGLFFYANQRNIEYRGFSIYGYSFIPPSPFGFKDWEKYDVSRYADPGCTHPTEGTRSVEAPRHIEFQTIEKDLKALTGDKDISRAIMLFHSPPYNTWLDRAALDGQMIDHVPLDPHVGSIAIQRFIQERQPHLSLHGHIHESTRLTGKWMQKIKNTIAMNAAHDGSELSVIKFKLENPGEATRFLYF